MSQSIRVFISYSHDDDAHREFVLRLANRLRAEGIESWIDQYVQGSPPETWQRWMEKQIEQADFVLMVCTPLYLKRFRGEDREGGRGVNFESVLIAQILYDNYYYNPKFIPVIPESGSFEHVPLRLKGYNTYQLFRDYESLYRLLTTQPAITVPPVGQTVRLPEKTLSSSPPVRADETAYLETLLQQRQILFADQTYTTLAGEFQQDRQLMPDECMPASFLFEAHLNGREELRECHSKPEKHDDLLEAFARHKRLALLGEPGTGKTFSLWRIAAEQARKALDNATTLLPVVIPLNRWTDERQPLHEFVLEQMGGLSYRYDELRRAGRLLPLLDALNEIPFEQRKVKLDQVKAFVNQTCFNHLLLTCRERDYTGKLEQDMDRLTIEPLDPLRIRLFLRNYFAYFNQRQPGGFLPDVADSLFWQLAGNEKLSEVWQVWEATGASFEQFWTAEDIPKENPNVYEKTSGEHDRVWTECRHDPRSLMKLAENPYLLSLITTIYIRDKELPRSRIGLFDRFTQDLLVREEVAKAKSRESVPERHVMLEALKQLAWRLQRHIGLQEEARTTLPKEDAAKIMGHRDLLEFAASASLLELTRDSVRFSHQLLQEFFTAQRFGEERAKGLQASEFWPVERWWEPSGWEEATKMAFGYAEEPEAFLQWLAAGNPKLAYEIADEQKLLNQELFIAFRDQWRQVITDIERYPDPRERHAISTLLAKFGWDNRPSIGLNVAGLPDIDWVEIPAGEFTYQDGERLSLPIYKMSIYPVTNAQFQVFVADGGYENDEWWQDLQKPDSLPSHSWTEGNRPVESVSWYDAMAFCRWLSKKLDLDIRLPTEEQWEKAARGTDGREYPWGNGYKTGYANINETYGEAGIYNLQETSAVGIYPQGQSPYGLMDMSGNVWEWCLNKYHEPQITTADVSGGVRVVRGGAWNYATEYCRSSSRLDAHPLYRSYNLGFRLLCCFPH